MITTKILCRHIPNTVTIIPPFTNSVYSVQEAFQEPNPFTKPSTHNRTPGKNSSTSTEQDKPPSLFDVEKAKSKNA